MTSDVTLNSAMNQANRTNGAQTKLAEDFSQFLTLLTTQLQNQDPLSPMDTTEFTNQLVAFTGVEQQINTNQKLDSLVALQLGNAVGQSIGYVGKDIRYVSSEFSYDGENAQTLKYALDEQASSSKIRIVDESGEIIYETNGATSTGQHEFTWDGTTKDGSIAVPGTYSVRIDALDANDKAVDSTVVVEGRVKGIESQNGQIFAIVGDRAVSLGNVLSVSDPNASLNTSLNDAFDYIGQTVSFTKSTFNHGSKGAEETLGYRLNDKAEKAYIRIYNESGVEIFKDDISTAEGQNSYVWNGTLQSGAEAPAGAYSYQIDARDEASNSIAYDAINKGVVTDVTTKGGTIYVNIGNKASIPIDEIVGFG